MSGYSHGAGPHYHRPRAAGPNVPLVAPRDADLTAACVKCGNPYPTQTRQAQVVWVPPGVYLTLLISWLITVIVYYYMRKISRHNVALCDPCAAEWDAAGVEMPVAAATGMVGFLAGLGLMFGAYPAVGVALVIGAPIIGIAGTMVAQRKRLTAALVDEHEVRLKGVSPAYPSRPMLPPPDPYNPYQR